MQKSVSTDVDAPISKNASRSHAQNAEPPSADVLSVSSESCSEDYNHKAAEEGGNHLDGMPQNKIGTRAHNMLPESGQKRQRNSKELTREHHTPKKNTKERKKKDKKTKKNKKKKSKKTKKSKKGKRHKKDVTDSSSGTTLVVSPSPHCTSGREHPATRFKQALAHGNLVLAQHVLNRYGLQWCNTAGDTPLHIAVQQNQLQLVTWILGQQCAMQHLNQRNKSGETPLLTASKLSRGRVALVLVEALADPGITDKHGEGPEAFDLNGLLRETELQEATSQRIQHDQVLEAVAAARRCREEAEWRERLFFETGCDDDSHYAQHEDLERSNTGQLHWMDEIALQAAKRAKSQRQQLFEAQQEAARQAQQELHAQQKEQEAKWREFEKAQHNDFTSSRTTTSAPSNRQITDSSADSKDIRIAARATDEARWQDFEDRVVVGSSATSMEQTCLRASDIPWPSGPLQNPLHIDSRDHPAVVRSQLRAGLLRWHPDKFMQKVGHLLPDDSKEKIEVQSRVKDIAQQLNRLLSQLPKNQDVQ